MKFFISSAFDLIPSPKMWTLKKNNRTVRTSGTMTVCDVSFVMVDLVVPHQSFESQTYSEFSFNKVGKTRPSHSYSFVLVSL